MDKIENGIPLEGDAKDLSNLYIFIAFQHVRTKRSKIKYEEIMGYLVDAQKEVAINKAKEKGINLTKEDFDCEFGTHLFVISLALERFPMLIDLKPSLIVNNTSIDLITNDCGVVFYNILYSHIKNVGKAGLASKGLIVYAPITSKIGILLLDSTSYDLRETSEELIVVDENKDILELNELIFLNSENKIYFENDNQKYYIDYIIDLLKEKKNDEIVQFNEHEKQKKESGGFTQTITFHEKDLNHKLNLTFIRIKKDVDPNNFQFFRSKELKLKWRE